jgi:hypothetical protein
MSGNKSHSFPPTESDMNSCNESGSPKWYCTRPKVCVDSDGWQKAPLEYMTPTEGRMLGLTRSSNRPFHFPSVEIFGGLPLRHSSAVDIRATTNANKRPSYTRILRVVVSCVTVLDSASLLVWTLVDIRPVPRGRCSIKIFAGLNLGLRLRRIQ